MSHTKKVQFCWIPSHIGIQRNHEAYSVAKSAQNIASNKNSKIPYTGLKPKELATAVEQKYLKQALSNATHLRRKNRSWYEWRRGDHPNINMHRLF